MHRFFSGSDNISFALEDLHILDELKTIELHQVFKLSEPTQNATPFSEITSLSLTYVVNLNKHIMLDCRW